MTALPAASDNSSDPITPAAVMQQYADLAEAAYQDALSTAIALQEKITAFRAAPSAATQQAAKDAWLAARKPYSQTEAWRFGNPNVDDWEGQVNAWPLDEGLIDYVQTTDYEHEEGNAFATANIIAGSEVINADLLRSYQEKGGSEGNVATGYHAIEFLLWGQDLNENPQAAGQRPYTDFIAGEACTHDHCERRATYLQTAADLLVNDLQTMVADWAGDTAGGTQQDNYRKTFLALPEQEALRRMLFGMGSLSLGELAGQRMNVALLAHSQEDEHSCFSDNTHHDIAENARSIQNIYLGQYTRTDGSTLKGASLAALAGNKDPAIAQALTDKLADTAEKTAALVRAAEQGMPFDQQISAGNDAGNLRVKAAISALRAQTADIEAVAGLLGVTNLNASSQ